LILGFKLLLKKKSKPNIDGMDIFLLKIYMVDSLIEQQHVTTIKQGVSKFEENVGVGIDVALREGHVNK